MVKFKLGDRVKIKKTSSFWGNGGNNPKDEVGVVVKVHSSTFTLPIDVKWSLASSNSYASKDLVLVGPVKPRVVKLKIKCKSRGVTTVVFKDGVAPATTLPTDSKARKEFPIYSGVLKYFPRALAGVARVSQIGNEKHRPGKPLGHARKLSTDEEDCIIRHLIDKSEDFGKGVGFDEGGVAQVDYIAWRALALCQKWHEEHSSAPLAPAADYD